MKIGLRVDLNDFKNINEFNHFLKVYFHYFNIIEIKITNKIDVIILNELYHYMERNNLKDISFHLPKNILSEEITEFEFIILYIKKLFNEYNMLFIVHYYGCYNKENLDYIFDILNKKRICIENVEVQNDFNSYINSMIKFIKKNNSSICFDIGHYMYSVLNNDLPNQINKFFCDSDLILEYHIHDTTLQKCHIPIGNGNIDFVHVLKNMNCIKYSRFIIEVNCNGDFNKAVLELYKLRRFFCGVNRRV